MPGQVQTGPRETRVGIEAVNTVYNNVNENSTKQYVWDWPVRRWAPCSPYTQGRLGWVSESMYDNVTGICFSLFVNNHTILFMNLE